MIGWFKWISGGLWRHRRGVGAILAACVAFTALVLWQNRDMRGARTIDDPAFEKAANALCLEELRPLAAVRSTSADDPKDTAAENAKQVTKVVEKLEDFVVELRAIPHQARFDGELEAWFDDFDAYIAAGRRYATALKTGDKDEYERVDDEGVAPLTAIRDFALANHIDNCVP